MSAKDNRLQVFDQILEINATKITTEMNHEQLQRLIKQVQSKVRLCYNLYKYNFKKYLIFFCKVKMIVYRAEPSETQPMDIELSKKSGKILGLGFFVGNSKGLFITDIVIINHY